MIVYLPRRVLRGSTITKAREDRKRFLLYCVYAWGLSLLVSILAIVADSTEILPDYLQPDIGNRGCWFTRESFITDNCCLRCNANLSMLIMNFLERLPTFRNKS